MRGLAQGWPPWLHRPLGGDTRGVSGEHKQLIRQGAAILALTALPHDAWGRQKLKRGLQQPSVGGQGSAVQTATRAPCHRDRPQQTISASPAAQAFQQLQPLGARL